MYVKITNDQPVEFPYTIGQFRRDNPYTSFPKQIPDTMLKRHNVHPVIEMSKPAYDPLVQDLVMDEMPHKEVIRVEVDEETQEERTIYGNLWLIGYSVVNKSETEAAAAIRSKRDSLLAETDWMALSDNTLTEAWATYRQQLRDISDQAGFPYSVIWPAKP
jgi:hypothetical protein